MSQTGSTLGSEWSLLRLSCAQTDSDEKTEGIRYVLQQPIQWDMLLPLAERHGVQCLLHQSLSRVSAAVAESAMRSLQAIYQVNLHKSLFLARELIRIVDHLRSAGAEVLPYKGPALAETYYGDIALRPAGDIDLLIQEADLSRIREAVKQLGYIPHWSYSPSQERAFVKSGYECAFDGPAGANLLEVQWDLQPKFYAVDFDMKGLFARAITTSVAGYSIKTPSPEDQLLILALHASKHVWSRIIWLCDLSRVMHLRDLDWKWIASQAMELGIVRILQVSALLADRFVGNGIPLALHEHLPPDPAAEKFAKEIEGRVRSNSAYDVESFEYFRLMVQLRERARDRLRFITRLAFTPGPGEWNRVRLPEAVSPLYRLVRLSRVAGKIARR
jgi:Uncharacterised nucleotidyltransferase